MLCRSVGTSRVGVLGVLLGLVVVAGCSEELGRDPFVTTRVTGLVTLGKKPVGGGFIEFVPLDGAVGVLRTAPIQPDGTFEVDGVAVGPNKIAVVGAPILRPLLDLFETLNPYNPLDRLIKPGQPAVVELDLLAESYRVLSAPRLPDTVR